MLLLDEPFNGMDPRQRLHLMDLLRRMGAEGRTVLFSSHILEEVEQVARQIEVVVSGRHAASGDFGADPPADDRPAACSTSCVADDDRALAASLIAEPSVRGRRAAPRAAGSTCRSSDFGAFAVRLPRVAREHGIRHPRADARPTSRSRASSPTWWAAER